MNDKLIVVLDSILHLLLEERPIINHIKPAILMTPVDSLTLCYVFIFLIDVYNDMRIIQNVASGSGTGWIYDLGSLGWIYLWYIVWWIKSVKSCSLHRSGLRPVPASLLESLVLLDARREMHGGLVAARRTGDSRGVPSSAEVHGQTGRVRSAASSLRDGCRRRAAYRVVRCSSEVSTCSSASFSSATAGTAPVRSSRTCIQVGALMWLYIE